MLKNRIFTYTDYMSDILEMDDSWHLDQMTSEIPVKAMESDNKNAINTFV